MKHLDLNEPGQARSAVDLLRERASRKYHNGDYVAPDEYVDRLQLVETTVAALLEQQLDAPSPSDEDAADGMPFFICVPSVGDVARRTCDKGGSPTCAGDRKGHTFIVIDADDPSVVGSKDPEPNFHFINDVEIVGVEAQLGDVVEFHDWVMRGGVLKQCGKDEVSAAGALKEGYVLVAKATDGARKPTVTPDTEWRHRNGARYTVQQLVNVPDENTTAERSKKYPLTVVYESVDSGKRFSRPLADWHRSMTLVN